MKTGKSWAGQSGFVQEAITNSSGATILPSSPPPPPHPTPDFQSMAFSPKVIVDYCGTHLHRSFTFCSSFALAVI
jgi:hypothetical protein